MALPVVTIASGGLPVVDVALVVPSVPLQGMPVTEATNGRGTPVTKVAASPAGGLPVVYVTVPPSP